MKETKPAAADVIEFVGRGVRAQCVADAAELGSRVALVRARLEAAIAAGDVGEFSMFQWMRDARAELGELELALARHFERFAR